MALDDITLVNAASANVVYKYTGVGKNDAVLRKDFTRSLETPCVLSTSHATSGKGSSMVDRHLSRLDLTELDADGVSTYVGSLYVVAVAPRRIIDADMMWDLYKQLTSRFATQAAFAAWLQGLN